jgi:TonB family protein
MLLTSARTARQNRLFAIFGAVSLVAHVAAVTTYAILSLSSAPAVKLEDNVIKTRLVKLGKQRDDKLLPRLDGAAPPPPTNAKKAPDVKEPPKDKAPEQKPTPDSKPSASDILQKFAKDSAKPTLDSLIDERMGEPLDEGHEDGNKLGTDITGRLKADYNDFVKAKVQQEYSLPTTLTDDDVIRLQSFVLLKIGADGELLDVGLSPPSGNSAFDGAVIAAAKKAGPFPPPPLQLRDFYANGIRFRMCPRLCT